ncbi:MAG: outer membrane beta-barrel protein [Bacteroidales bacterium]
MATKNLPADATIVQLYNKKSEESEFTGIEDGSRNQTLNLMLDEDKKDGIFGDLTVGGATGSHYQANGKIYRFSEKNQIAALGMMNNVNKFGFSIGDYLSFTGGIARISHGEGGATIGSGGFPINFGETIAGYSSSGAAGFNFSHSKSKNQRAFISYVGNGSKRELNENTRTTLYRETGSFLQEENSSRILRDTSHTINFGVRNLFRETNNIIINGNVSLNTGFVPLTSTLESYQDNILVNSLTRVSSDLSDRLSGNVTGTYLKRINEGKSIFKINGSGSISSSSSETLFENQADYFDPVFQELVSQFQDNTIKSGNYNGTISFTQKIKGPYYADLYFKAGNSSESLKRRQGNSAAGDAVIDSLSPSFTKDNLYFGPGITLRRNLEKSTFSLGVEYNFGTYETALMGETPADMRYGFIQPRMGWEYEYKTGRRLMVSYNTRTNIPSVSQLMPVVNNFNTLSLFYGNQELEPEYIHSATINWWIFDQFSFTSLLSSARVSYTKNKINYSRSVDENLVQTLRLVNVESDLSAGGTIDFSTPIKRLGIKVNLSLDENYNRGINIVNDTENMITSLTHRASLTFDNRRKERIWDVNTGFGVTLTNARIFIFKENLNNTYYDLSWFR